ncbi:NAD-dependent deacetylase hst3 [Coemansia spiralis]|nr:NAD-dependent deacetylase hst3 [Coemansia spiralis]
MRRFALDELEPGAVALCEIQRAVQGCQRCLVITGAGISVSSGIPDFRSPGGLFQQLKQRYPGAVSSGRDLFDATLFGDPGMVGLFYNFMGELRNLVTRATCTPTHAFIKQLDEHSKLLRCYTQNIDSLERRIGLETMFQKRQPAASSGSSSSSECNGSDAATQEPPVPPARRRRRQATLDKTFTRAVQLHGNLDKVVCTICHTDYPFSEKMAEEFCEGTPPPCPRCKEIEVIRDIVGKRSVATGVLRPDIVLYNEAHPQAELIGELSEYDLKQRPDLLIVIGTSLKIPGIKRMVREMSKCVHSCTQRSKRAGAGKVIFINRDEPPRGWDDVFDYYIAGDADEVIGRLPILAPAAETSTGASISSSRRSSVADLDLPAAAAAATLPGERRPRIAGKPLADLLPPSKHKAGLARKPAAKPKARKLTSMMRVVKAPPATITKPKTTSRTLPKRHISQHPCEPTEPPLVPPPQCS